MCKPSDGAENVVVNKFYFGATYSGLNKKNK